MSKSLLMATIAAVAIAACDLLGGTIPLGGPTFADAPAAVTQRVSLPPCGEETVGLNEGFDIEGRECLWAAYGEGRPAEFVSTLSTMEGDPITFIYRVLPDGSVEVFIDSTHDKWSAMTWLHLACPGLSLVDGAPGQPAFAPGLGDGPAEVCLETTLH